jgi:hypothetical protein
MAGEIGLSDAKADNIGFEQRDAPAMPRDVFWVRLRVIAHRPRASIERVSMITFWDCLIRFADRVTGTSQGTVIYLKPFRVLHGL